MSRWSLDDVPDHIDVGRQRLFHVLQHLSRLYASTIVALPVLSNRKWWNAALVSR